MESVEKENREKKELRREGRRKRRDDEKTIQFSD